MSARAVEKSLVRAPFYRSATQRSKAKRVGFWLRGYWKPLCAPALPWAQVEVGSISTITAPVEGSGCWPAWIARVSNARRLEPSVIGSPSSWPLSAAQVVDQVDAGDQTQELAAFQHNGHLVAFEYGDQRVERLVGLQG